MSRGLRLPCLLVLACVAMLVIAAPAAAVPNRFDTYVRNTSLDVAGAPIGGVSSAFIDAVAVDSLGAVYFTESDWYIEPKRVVRVDLDRSRHVINVGDVGAPTGIAVASDGTVWVTDNATSELVGIRTNGEVIRRGQFGEASGVGLDPDYLYSPAGVAIDADGIVYVSDDAPNNRIARYDSVNDVWLTPLGGPGVGSSQFNGPEQVAYANGKLYVVERVNNRVSVWDCASGTNAGLYNFFDDVGHGLDTPCGIAVDGEGTMYVADTMHKRFARINAAGRSLGAWPAAGDPHPLDVPYEIAVAPGGGIWIADQGFTSRPSSLRRFDFVPGIPDTTPPQTRAFGSTGDWTRQPVNVTLSASDASSTIAGTWYSRDGSYPEIPYSSAISIATEGVETIKFFSADSECNTESVKSVDVKIDFTSPVTTATVESDYYGQAVIDISSQDALSGMNQVLWSIDNGPQQYSSTIRYSAEYGTHTVRFWGIDNANNAELPHTETFTLHPPDFEAPTTHAEGIPSEWATGTVNVRLVADDPGSGVHGTFYRLGTSQVETYTGEPIPISKDGVHTLTFWSVDDQDNVEPQKTAQIRIDRLPPTTLATVKPTYNTTPIITLVPEDLGSGIAETYWRIDDDEWQTGITVTGSSVPGNHTIDWYSVDNLGRIETLNSASYLFLNRIEEDDPRAVFTPGWWTASLAGYSSTKQRAIDGPGSAFVLFTGTRCDLIAATGPNQGIASVSIDGEPASDVDLYAPQMNYQAKVAHFEVDDGTHRVKITWTGRRNPASVGTAIGIDAYDFVGDPIYDTVPPTMSVSGVPSGWISGDASLDLSANDAETYVLQMLAGVDGGVPQPCESPYPFSIEGTHTLVFSSVDGAGNHSSDSTAVVRIDRTAPLTSDDASLTTGGTYQYDTTATVTLTPNDTMSGPGTTWWKLDNGAWNVGTTVVIGNNFGAHVLQYYSTDAVGNQELPQTLAFEIQAPDSDAARDDSRIVYHEDWAWGLPPGWSDNGSAKVTDQPGTAVFGAFTGYRLKWAAQRGPNMGKATIQIDNGYIYTVDLYAPYVQTGVVVFDTYTISNTNHTVAIRWTGAKNVSSNGTKISLTNILIRGVGLTNVSDTVAPTTSSNAPSGWVNGPISVSLSSSDAITGVENVYATSNGTTPTAQTPYAGPITVSAEGTTTLNYYAEDIRGNKEAVKSSTVTIDNSAPNTTMVDLKPSYLTTATIALSAIDPYSGVATTKWRVDGGEWQTGTVVTVPQAFGLHNVEWYSVDALNHTETTRSAQVLIARRYEQTDAKLMWQNTWSTVSTSVASAGSQTVLDSSGAMYALLDGTDLAVIAPRGPDLGIARIAVDGGAPVDIDLYSPTDSAQKRVYTLSGLASGTHRIRIDWSGRRNGSSAGTKIVLDALETSGQIVADTSAPTLTLSGSVADGVWTKDSFVSVTPAYSDPDSFVTAIATVGASQPTTISGPVLVSAEGQTLVTVDAIDGAGNKTTKTYLVKIDRTGPTVSDDAPTGWIDHNADVSLTATDTGSGPDKILVSTDGGVPTALYTGAIPVTAEGVTTIRFKGVDVLGNTGAESTRYVKIDKSAPVTTPSVAIAPSYLTTTTITLVAADPNSGVASTKWRVDGGAWQTGTSATVPNVIGEHTLEWYSTDALGHVETTKSAKTVIVRRMEETDPNIYFRGTWSTVSNGGLSGGAMKSASSPGASVQFTFSGTQVDWITSRNTSYGKALVTVDSSAPVEVDLYGSFAFKQRVWSSGIIPAGIHRIKIEYLGQKNASSTGFTVPVDAFDIAGDLVADTTPPVTNIEASSAWRTTPETITLTAADTDSWVATTYYKVGQGALTSYSAPFLVSAEGTTTVEYYSVDALGNREASRFVDVRMDREAPTVSCVHPLGWTRGPVFASLSAEDLGSGMPSIFYSVDGADPVLPYTGQIPITLEGTTTIRARAFDALNNASATSSYNVLIDDSAPRTRDDAPSLWTSGTVNVRLTADDQLSHTASTSWALDSGLSTTYQGPVTVEGEGVHSLAYSSTDNAGNVEQSRSATIQIDNSAPITRSNAATSYAGSASIALTPSDSLSGAQKTAWRLDGGPWTEGTAVTVNIGGRHTLEWMSTDVAGNIEQPQSATFDISKHYEQGDSRIAYRGTWATASHPSLSGGSYTYTYTPGSYAAFVFEGVRAEWTTSKSSSNGKARVIVDNGSPVEVDLYSASAQFKQKVFSTGDLPNGVHTLRIEYTGTKNPASAGYNVGLDALDFVADFVTDSTAPTTTGDFGAAGWSRTPAPFTLSANDPTAGVMATYYKLNSGSAFTYSGPVTVATEGTTTVSYWSVDGVGNAESARVATLQVDSVAPTTTAAVLPTYDTSATVTLSPVDASSGVVDTRWRIDGGAWSHGTAASATGLGNHTLEYYSTDVAGNAETVKSAQFTIINRYEQTDPNVALGGTWSTVNHSSLSGGSYASTFAEGSFAEVTFSGSRIDWITSKSTSYGKARLVLDGAAPVEVDLYASSAQFKQRVWSSGDIANGSHTLRIEYTATKNTASTGTNIGVDALEVVGTLTGRHYEQTDANIMLQGTWSSVSHPSLSGGSYTYTYTSGSTAYVSFVGTRLDWTTSKSSSSGKARITLDGTSTADVDLYAAAAQFKQRVWSTGDLPSGLHTIKIENVGAKNAASTGFNVGIDAVDVTGVLVAPQISLGTRFEQGDSKIAYAGTWSTVSNSSLSGGSHAYTSTAGSAALVDFTGTKIDYIASKSSNYGKARLTLDNGSPVEVDLYAASPAYQQKVWSSGDLAPGAHSLKIEYLGTKNAASNGYVVGIDAFNVVGTLSQATLGPTLQRFEQTDSKLAYQGTWSTLTNGGLSGGSFASASATGCVLTVKFTGTKATWVASRNTSYGIAKVSVDDGPAVDVDLYGAFGFQQKVWSSSDLPDQTHTLRIEWTGTKNSSSSGSNINVDAIEVVGALVQAP